MSAIFNEFISICLYCLKYQGFQLRVISFYYIHCLIIYKYTKDVIVRSSFQTVIKKNTHINEHDTS